MIVKYSYSRDFPTEIVEYTLSTTKVIKKGKSPRITICAIFNEETNVLSLGVSRCSPKDVFVKKVGKELAYNRAMTNPQMTIKLSKGERFSPVFYDLIPILEKRYLDGSYKL